MRNQRGKFSIPDDTTYLNCAYMSPMLKNVERAGIKGMIRKRNPAKISPQDFFTEGELLRKEFSKTIHARDTQRIVIIPSVSYGIANVVRNVSLSSDENVIVTGAQFPGNYYPWHRLCKENGATLRGINPPDTFQSRGKIWNERILDAINSKTRIVALGHVHWTDGTLFNLLEIRKRTQSVGALLIIDGTQSVGALPFDVQKIKPDALVCGGYKWLLGPYSMGLAYYGEYFDKGKPIEENWINRRKSEDFTGLVNYQDDYQEGSLKYEVGEHSNFILVPMMLEALKQINQWKPENIQQYCASISKRAIENLRGAGCWVEDDAYRAAHLFGVRFPNRAPSPKLGELLKKKKILVSFRGDSVRVSPNVYNDADELDRLVKALTS